MYGIVRAVEYNATTNQSRLHFECVTLPPKMKTDILNFVYNVIPQEEKDAYDAIAQAEEDAKTEDSEIEDIEHENQELSNVEASTETQDNVETVKNEEEKHTEKFEAFLKVEDKKNDKNPPSVALPNFDEEHFGMDSDADEEEK